MNPSPMTPKPDSQITPEPVVDPAASAGQTVPVVAPFTRLYYAELAQHECEERISEILGIQLLGISWDHYDDSFEIYPWEDVTDVAPTDEQHKGILALGCVRYWINFKDGSQRYCKGQRVAYSGGNRWEQHNNYSERKRRDEEEISRLRMNSRRYEWLRGVALWFNDARNAVEVHEFVAPIAYGPSIDAAIDSALNGLAGANEPDKQGD